MHYVSDVVHQGESEENFNAKHTHPAKMEAQNGPKKYNPLILQFIFKKVPSSVKIHNVNVFSRLTGRCTLRANASSQILNGGLNDIHCKYSSKPTDAT